jgi:hypothetical protein
MPKIPQNDQSQNTDVMDVMPLGKHCLTQF